MISWPVVWHVANALLGSCYGGCSNANLVFQTLNLYNCCVSHSTMVPSSKFITHATIQYLYTVCFVLKVYRVIICKLCSLCIPGTPLTLGSAFTALLPVRYKWFNIGLQLGVPVARLNIIEKATTRARDGLVAMLDYWMNNATDPLLSWKVLVNALKTTTVGENRLADELEERYCRPEDHSSLGEREPYKLSVTKTTCSEWWYDSHTCSLLISIC